MAKVKKAARTGLKTKAAIAGVQKVVYADIQAYLDAIADNPDDNSKADNANHGRFWQMKYQDFVSGTVPGENCHGALIPITGKVAGSPNVDPLQCPFYQALKNSSGWCSKGQMPKNGPPKAFITDPAYKVTLKNGQVITGAEIQANIETWLSNGLPES
jgi:hypothetical protein